MSNPALPEMPYLTEPERAQLHPAVVRTTSIPSIPPNFPFNTPISDERRYRGPRFVVGWLEFQSPEQPDPEVARPGDVWIQLPSGHRKARVYACYSPQGKDWSPWSGNNLNVTLGNRSNIPMHPLLNDQAQRRFYLVFNGSEFIWANPKGVSVVARNDPQLGAIGPAEAVIKWLKVTGVGRTSPVSNEEDVRSTSAPQGSRKHAHPDQSGSLGDSASAPPAKKPKHNPSSQPLSSPDRPLAVKLGAYAKAGATQQGWIMYIDGMPLYMPFPCINCTRIKAPCSGIPGERCGRCRFKRLGCSHHTQNSHDRATSPAKESPKAAAAASPPTAQPGLMLRLPPLRPWVPVSTADVARPKDANKVPEKSSPRRVRIRSSSVAHSDNGSIRSSPLSPARDPTDPVPPHSETAILDARDDAAVENLLDSASAAVSVVPAPGGDGEAEQDEPPSSVTVAEVSAPDKTPLQEETRGEDGNAVGGGDEEDEEFARFVQMTLDGMARAQEGLRGVFALTRRRLVKPDAVAAQQVAGVGEATPAAAAVQQVAGAGEATPAAAVAPAHACAPGGDHGPMSAPH